MNRVAGALDTLAARHAGQLVVVACHAGVIEASLLAKLPVAGGLDGARLQLRTRHASLTTWEVDAGRWRLLGYNDASHPAVVASGEASDGGEARADRFSRRSRCRMLIRLLARIGGVLDQLHRTGRRSSERAVTEPDWTAGCWSPSRPTHSGLRASSRRRWRTSAGAARRCRPR